MTRLRKGDKVLFAAVVTDVADYDQRGQQIQAKLLPKGAALGWCVPGEYDFKPDELVLRVGDRVRLGSRTADEYEVLFLSEGKQAVVRKVGNWPIEVVATADLRRL